MRCFLKEKNERKKVDVRLLDRYFNIQPPKKGISHLRTFSGQDPHLNLDFCFPSKTGSWMIEGLKSKVFRPKGNIRWRYTLLNLFCGAFRMREIVEFFMINIILLIIFGLWFNI